MGFRIGHKLVFTVFGAAHDVCVGGMLEGIPVGKKVDLLRVEAALAERRPRGKEESPRVEEDRFLLLSGLQEGHTTPSPLVFALANDDIDPSAYDPEIFRPGHADLSAFLAHGRGRWKTGGGIASGRMTAPIVAAGAVVLPWLEEKGIRIGTEVCFGEPMCGTEVRVVLSGMAPGIGRPFFDSLEGVLAHAFFAVPGVKAIAFGQGASLSRMTACEAADPYRMDNERIRTDRNVDGGIQGGMTTGENVVFTVWTKPIPSQAASVETVDIQGRPRVWRKTGRHDRSIARRLEPIYRSLAALVLADEWLLSGRTL